MTIHELQSAAPFIIRHPESGDFLSVINITTDSLLVSQTLHSCQRANIPIDYSYLTLAIFLSVSINYCVQKD